MYIVSRSNYINTSYKRGRKMNKENIITQIKKNSNEVYRISEKEYEGYRFIDVRIYYQDRKTQEWKPTQKGISIMPNNAGQIIEGILKAMEVMGFSKEPTLDDVEQIQQGIVNNESDNS